MRTTVDIDDDVLAAARAIAAEQRRSLGRVLSEIARRGLAPRPRMSDAGLPCSDVPADAPVITSEVVARALDDQ